MRFTICRAGIIIDKNPLRQLVASVSVGIFKDVPILDLDYLEDSSAQTDMNVVMTDQGKFIEVQGTGEDGEFSLQQLQEMIALAGAGIRELIRKQQEVLG